jgi:small subunit ribosomal protein S1
MAASYDEQGNYLYPEGFDSDTGEWLEGFDEQRAAWESQYAEAHARWEAHKKQVVEAENAEGAAATAGPTTYSSSTGNNGSGGGSDAGSAPTSTPVPEGSLASDEALQALREKLTGGAS